MLQVFMFVTPIMWPVTSLNENARVIVEYNPFAAVLHMVTQPLQGIVPSLWEYSIASGTLLLLMAFGLYIFARFRARIVYWL
jgi:lipopolysaccharide transport system permease protein